MPLWFLALSLAVIVGFQLGWSAHTWLAHKRAVQSLEKMIALATRDWPEGNKSSYTLSLEVRPLPEEGAHD